MNRAQLTQPDKISRNDLITFLNEDLSREYRSLISAIASSQILNELREGIVIEELVRHAKAKLQYSLRIARHIASLGGRPTVVPKENFVATLTADPLDINLDQNKAALTEYHRRIRQAEALGERDLAATLRQMANEEEKHVATLAVAMSQSEDQRPLPLTDANG